MNLSDSKDEGLLFEREVRRDVDLRLAGDVPRIAAGRKGPVGRGATEGFVPTRDACITGSNLTATKARILLMAALMKLGCLPSAVDPDNPTPDERTALREKVRQYQTIFDTH
jgi:hypothetical protein